MNRFWKQHLSGQGGRSLLAAALMAGPGIILLLIFMVWPFVRGIQLSRTNQRFDGSAPAAVGSKNYDRIFSVTVVRLPPVPDPLPDRASSGWYRGSDGSLIFRWRNLEEVGLQKYEAYEIAQRIRVGSTYYAIVAKDAIFWKALINNFIFVAYVVPIQTTLGLLLALLVNQKLRAVNVFRTVYFSPVVTAIVVIAVVWSILYNPQQGLINQMLKTFSGGRLGPFGWLTSPKMAMPAIVIMSIWQGAGFQMVVFLAGLQDIPEDLYEAAGIDGANAWQKFRFVTLPLLRNTLVFIVLATTILAFRLFDQVQVMTPTGGPERSTATLVWYAIRTGWRESFVGYASAISVVFVVIVLAVSLLQRVVIRSESAYG